MLRTCISCRHNVNQICQNIEYYTGNTIPIHAIPKCGYKETLWYTPSHPLGYRPIPKPARLHYATQLLHLSPQC